MPLSFALLVAVKVVMYLMIVLLSAHTSDMNYLLQIEVYHISCIAQYSYFTKTILLLYRKSVVFMSFGKMCQTFQNIEAENQPLYFLVITIM